MPDIACRNFFCGRALSIQVVLRGPGCTICGSAVKGSTSRRCRRHSTRTTKRCCSPEAATYTPMVHRLGCLRGISTLTGFGLAVEIGDWQRFTGSTIGSYVGLVPSEYSSGTPAIAEINHQDRQRSRTTVIGRVSLASPQDLPQPWAGHAHSMGELQPRCACLWTCRQSPPASSVGAVHRP